MAKDYERLIKATVELGEISSRTKDDDIRYAAAVGYNYIMEIMKRKDKKFWDEVIYLRSH